MYREVSRYHRHIYGTAPYTVYLISTGFVYDDEGNFIETFSGYADEAKVTVKVRCLRFLFFFRSYRYTITLAGNTTVKTKIGLF